MGQQSGTYATPRLDLGAAYMEFVDQPGDLVGVKLMPIFKTMKQAATFGAITRESITRTVDAKRTKKSGYNRDSWVTEDKSYSCKEYGLEDILGDDERSFYKTDFDAELVTVKAIERKIKIAQEIRIAEALFNTTTFTGSALYTNNSAAPWDAAASDVIGQVDAAKEKVRQNCGMKANAIWFSETNLIRLKSNTAIKDAIKYVSIASEEAIKNALAGLFGIKYVFIAGGIKNSAKEGQAFSGSDVWSDDYAQVGVIAEDGQDLSSPAIGRSFLWTEDSAENAIIEQYRDEPRRGDVFRVRHNVHELIIDPYFAHLIKVDA